MERAVHDAEEEGGEDDFVIVWIVIEKGLPSIRGRTGFCVLETRHDGREDEEWD